MKRKSSLPTVADVARVAGVGAITVSRFVNGISYVSAEKRKSIQAAINKLGYRPNQAARVLKGQRARIIGLIIPDLADPFFGKCASAIEDYASTKGYMTLVVASKRSREMQENELAMMIGQQVAGLIIISSLPSENLRQVVGIKIPIVALDQPIEGMLADQVVVENLGGAQAAVSHLIWHGHKRIACVGYDKNAYSIMHRILGYRNEVQNAGLKPEIHDKVQTPEDARRLVRSWAGTEDRPTAVFTLNNVATRSMLQALREEGLSIPGNMAIIGFDDLELASLLSPPLTVIRQPATELGTQAVRLLFERIHTMNNPVNNYGIKLVLPVEFVVRGSCGCTQDESKESPKAKRGQRSVRRSDG